MTRYGVDELDRIVDTYRHRAATLPDGHDSLKNPAVLFVYQQRSRAMLNRLSAHALLPLSDKKILDVGCGDGQGLIDFETWGARRQNLAGIDLLEESTRLARLRLCGLECQADVRTGTASQMPWADATFDIAAQSTMFTSILDDGLRRSVAAEMRRVVRPGGVILWYDFRVNNPSNDAVRRVGAREIRALFAGCHTELSLITLAPPLARRLVPVSWALALVLEKLALFNTHYLGVIRVPRRGDGPTLPESP